MDDISTLIKEAALVDLSQTFRQDKSKYICYTKLNNAWFICVTNGTNVWKLEIDNDKLEDLANSIDKEVFLDNFRRGFLESKFHVEVTNSKMKLSVGRGSSCVSLVLYECGTSEAHTEIQDILFHLSDLSCKLKSDLETCHKKIEHLQAQKQQGTSSGFLDFGKKKKTPGMAKPSKVGMSVVNPTSKKRKAATGVVFD